MRTRLSPGSGSWQTLLCYNSNDIAACNRKKKKWCVFTDLAVQLRPQICLMLMVLVVDGVAGTKIPSTQ